MIGDAFLGGIFMWKYYGILLRGAHITPPNQTWPIGESLMDGDGAGDLKDEFITYVSGDGRTVMERTIVSEMNSPFEKNQNFERLLVHCSEFRIIK